jgi:hypothetical protein
MVLQANPILCGLNHVSSLGDGTVINLTWYQSYAAEFGDQIAYHIYFSTDERFVFEEGVKYIVIDGYLSANIIDLIPGQDYWFSVLPVEYDPVFFNFLSELPIAFDNVRFYPQSLLSSNISATDLLIPLIDTDFFPPSGVVKIGIELVQYTAIDTTNNTLIVPNGQDGVGAHLVLQSNSQYYIPASTNIGTGTINDLTLTNLDAPNDNWKILCVSIEQDGYGNPIPMTARFEVIGENYGNVRDGYTNSIIWVANDIVVNSVMFSFSITEVSQFQVGDYFILQTAGATPPGSGGRGFNNTPISEHTISGFDGYHKRNPFVSVIVIEEDNRWGNIYACQSRFEYPHFPFTILEGYHQVNKDYLSTDLEAADHANITFPQYDYAGYHRTDPVKILDGTCVGSYIGGQMGVIDAHGNYNIVRGLSLQQQNTQRQDIKLSIDGQSACLLQRVQTGITCACYLASSEYPDDRCPFCLGSKFVLGYQQYFNPRYSDGRIKVRISPTAENLKMREAGFESEFPLDMWALTVPTIKTRDVIVLFDQNDNEEFRYEVGDVVRNKTILGLEGGQTLKTFRIRKTDPIYQTNVFKNTSDFPQKIYTTLSRALGILPHSHIITTDEHHPSSWSQLTQVSQGHNHIVEIKNGRPTVREALGHRHEIVLKHK